MNNKDTHMISVGILAGGESLRMGQDKALLPVGRQVAIERVLQQVNHLSNDVILVTNTPDKYRDYLRRSADESGQPSETSGAWDGSTLPHAAPSYRLVTDIYPGKGALGGMYTAITAAHHPWCLVVACDMPFLNTALLSHLISLTPGFDVVVPRVEGVLETMHAVYGKDCLDPIVTRLRKNQLKIVDFFGDMRVRTVTRDEVIRFDPDFRSFLNMNTPDDWERLQELASEE
jgi:molybdopterin-guanine dinucleotide biosynthesis protein A